jgi:hypothetical protein
VRRFDAAFVFPFFPRAIGAMEKQKRRQSATLQKSP